MAPITNQNLQGQNQIVVKTTDKSNSILKKITNQLKLIFNAFGEAGQKLTPCIYIANVFKDPKVTNADIIKSAIICVLAIAIFAAIGSHCSGIDLILWDTIIIVSFLRLIYQIALMIKKLIKEMKEKDKKNEEKRVEMQNMIAQQTIGSITQMSNFK